MRRATLIAALALLAASPARAQQEAAPVDPRLAAALRDAVDGRLDTARAGLAALAKGVAPGSAAYPDLLFGEALTARTAADARQRLQRIVVEYPLSPWADDAALRLAQLEYAAGDHAAALRHAERFRTDHAQSPLQPTAALWAGRAALAVKDTSAACRWAEEGTARVGDDPATRDALAGIAARCRGRATIVAASTPPAPRDTARLPADVSKGAPAPATAAVEPKAPAASAPAAAEGTWRVQIIAAPTAQVAERELARARKAGFDGAITAEGGFHKVRLGGFATRADATAAAARVKAKLGGSPYVVRAP